MTPRRGPRPTAERLRRLLVILPWLMEQGEVPVTDAATRFGLSDAELVRDLELASMCGLPPFVDEMVDVFIDEGIIYAGVPRLFTRPLRITAPEGFALLAAARVARQVTGSAADDSALDRALAKLAAVLGDEGLVVDTPAPPIVAQLGDAARNCQRLRIGYWSAHSDRTSEREITPRLVFTDRGRWYVIADDHLTGEERTFRADRIQHATPTGQVDEPREVQAPALDSWFADADLPTAVLLVGRAGYWVAERYPTTSVTELGDGWRIELPVASERWLGELLLRLGATAVVEAPLQWRDLGARAAAEVLRRYDGA
ncbi:MAG TPA: WYL domain-containing protein [Ilumatobacteraceae bacterium]|nr:WYL domain-containing protein [Ilumatobacteraceae bacterium]